MKKEILDALKAKFDGVSDKILDRIADKLAKTVTSSEQVATAVEGVTFQQILDSYGDSRATEATQTAVRNYEQKHGLKDGEKVQTGGEPKKKQPETNEGDEDTPAWAKALIEQNKALSERLNKIDAERTSKTRRQQLETFVEKLPESLRKAYGHISIDSMSEEEFDTLKSNIEKEVTDITDDLKSRGVVFGQPAKQSGKQVTQEKIASKEELDAVASAMNIN